VYYKIEPIRAEVWLPDRCMPSGEPLDPKTVVCEAGCPSLHSFYTKGSREKLETLYRKVLDRTGCCGFVAWVGGRVVGYNNFFPREVAQDIKFYGWGRPEDDTPLTLVHNCISIIRNADYRRKHVGTRLIGRSLDWAKQNGWKRFEVHLVLPDIPAGFQNDQKSCQTFWNTLGFKVFRTEEACQETRDVYGVNRRYSMVLDLDRWQVSAIYT
jgi:GNAT superfamily N-acetyltransferase